MKGVKLLFQGKLIETVYQVASECVYPVLNTNYCTALGSKVSANDSDRILWHKRLGHASIYRADRLPKSGAVNVKYPAKQGRYDF